MTCYLIQRHRIYVFKTKKPHTGVWCVVYACALSSHDSVSSVNHPISNQKSSTGSFLPLFLLAGLAFPFTLFHFLLISSSKLPFKHTILCSPTHSLTHSLTLSCLHFLSYPLSTYQQLPHFRYQVLVIIILLLFPAMKWSPLCLESLFLLFSYLLRRFLLIGLVTKGKRRKLLWILKSLVSWLLLNYSLSGFFFFFNSFSWVWDGFQLTKIQERVLRIHGVGERKGKFWSFWVQINNFWRYPFKLIVLIHINWRLWLIKAIKVKKDWFFDNV